MVTNNDDANYILVNGDKELLKASKSKTKDDLWYLGM